MNELYYIVADYIMLLHNVTNLSKHVVQVLEAHCTLEVLAELLLLLELNIFTSYMLFHVC